MNTDSLRVGLFESKEEDRTVCFSGVLCDCEISESVSPPDVVLVEDTSEDTHSNKLQWTGHSDCEVNNSYMPQLEYTSCSKELKIQEPTGRPFIKTTPKL